MNVEETVKLNVLFCNETSAISFTFDMVHAVFCLFFFDIGDTLSKIACLRDKALYCLT